MPADPHSEAVVENSHHLAAAEQLGSRHRTVQCSDALPSSQPCHPTPCPLASCLAASVSGHHYQWPVHAFALHAASTPTAHPARHGPLALPLEVSCVTVRWPLDLAQMLAAVVLVVLGVAAVRAATRAVQPAQPPHLVASVPLPADQHTAPAYTLCDPYACVEATCDHLRHTYCHEYWPA